MTRTPFALPLLLLALAGAARGQEDARALLARLAQEGTTDAQADAIARALERQGPGAQPAMIAALPTLVRPRDVQVVAYALAEHPTPAARDALLGLCDDRRVEVRRFVLVKVWSLRDPAVGAALLRHVDDPDTESAEAALGGLARQAYDPCWGPLLTRLVSELGSEPPRKEVVATTCRALEAVLGRSSDAVAVRRFQELVAAGDGLERNDALLAIVARSQAPALLPYVVAIVEEAHPPLPTAPAPRRAAPEEDQEVGDAVLAEQALLDEERLAIFERPGPLDAFRPFSPEVVAVAAEQLGKAGHAPAFGALVRASLAREADVRRAALQGVWACARTEDERLLALRALANALGAADRRLRGMAHNLLQRHTKERLPLSLSLWLDWIEKREAERAQRLELEARAREAGFDRVEDYLAAHPEEAPGADGAPEAEDEEETE